MSTKAHIRRTTWMLVLWSVILACSCPLVYSGEVLIDDFKRGLGERWQEKTFQGKTEYRVVQDGDRWAIEAVSRASASGLYYKVDIDLKTHPVIAWSWKISHVLISGDTRKKEGDDCAARLYVIFPSWIFWKTRTITYVWANRLPKGEAIESPYTKNAFMIAIESGNENAGQWVAERRNVFDDYRRCFGEDPPRARAIAVMTDTDNTGESTTAWYGPIRFSSLK